MARPDHDSIETYVNITGASELIALQKLEEHGGDLNEALNAHFNGRNGGPNTNTVGAAQYDFTDMENQTQVGSSGSLLPLLSSIRSLNPFSLLDPNYRRSFLNGLSTSLSSGQAPSILHPREARELPLGFEDGNGQSGHLGLSHRRTAFFNGPDVYGNNGDESYNPAALNNSHLYDSNVEEDMLRAVIEASKREAEENGQDNLLGSSNELLQTQLYLEDDELARAVSLSLKTAEEEKTMRDCLQIMEVDNSTTVEGLRRLTIENGRLKQGSSSHRDGVNDGEENSVLKQSPNHGVGKFSQLVGDTFRSEEWGAISSKEHEEAVTLEAAYIGDISGRTSYPSMYAPHPRTDPDKTADPNSRHVANPPSPSLAAQRLLQEQLNKSADSASRHVARPPSPSLAAQRLLREQQDDEYLASLKADREKELKVVKEADKCPMNGGESSRKVLEEEEFERRLLASKEASLPQEPFLDDENAVSVLVRMPDGSRHGRRFLKSDKLQSLFDFIDVGKAVKPGTYKVVRSYPRRAFGVDKSASTLNEVGLTSKHEALFLEVI